MQKIYILLLAANMLSCGRYTREHDHEAAGGEEHQEHIAGYLSQTLFSTGFEYYITYIPPVCGETSEISVHITGLDDYRPVGAGEVRLILEGPGSTEKISTEPGEPGIYHFSITPSKSGNYSLTLSFRDGKINETLKGEDILIFESDEEFAALARHSDDDGLITFTKEQAWNSRFMVQPVSRGSFATVIRTGGEILAMPGEKKVISATSGGIILFPKKGMVQGSEVRKGDIILAVSGEDLADNNVRLRFSEALNSYEQSLSVYRRHMELFAERIVSEKEFIESRSRYRDDSARYFALKNSFNGGSMIIRAPVSGYIHELDVSEGEYVTAGQTLATVSANKIMLLRADLPQQYFGQLARIVTANFRPAYTDRVLSVSELGGRLMAKGFSVAENNHFMPVYFEVINDGTLLEGAFAEFYLKTASGPGMLIIPSEAVTEDIGNYYVYVQVDGEHYEKRLIRTAADDGMNTPVLNGLTEGERVVTNGAMLVKAASLASGLPVDSHQH